MAGTNKYGLARQIPDSVKLAVRQKSGFGCVLCGLSLYTYDHIDPAWVDARKHDAGKICLLCPNHHTRKTNGLLSIDEIKAAYENPAATRAGYSHDPEFRTCRRPLKVRLGNFVFNDPIDVLRIGGEVLLSVEDLEEGGLALSGRFYDRTSKLALEIKRNEWLSFAGNWDVERVGAAITIRERAGKLTLRVVAQSQNNIVFDKIAMNYREVGFVSSEGKTIEISHKGEPIIVHRPAEAGGQGIESKGPLEVGADGGVRLAGPTTLGAGTLQVGSPGETPRDRDAPYVGNALKVGRNDPCPCNGGKKYKRCHGASGRS